MVVLRAAVATALSVTLATAAHVSAGGLLPSTRLLLGMVALCFVGSALWLTRQTSRVSFAVLLVSAQATIHFEMTALAGHGGHPPTATSATGALTDGAHHVLADLTTDPSMMAAHVAAAAATGLLLGQAERALWAVLALVARAADFIALVLRVLLVAITPAPVARLPRADADDAPRRTSVRLADTHVRRGPPALLLAP
jgi:hypothetical protein